MTSGVYSISKIEVEGKSVELLDDGYMKDRDVWTEEIAEALADREGIQLTNEHWEVINYLRDYYEKFLVSPNVKILVKKLKETREDTSTKQLYELFPRGPAFQGCKIAGLPKPTNCIDG